MTTLPTVTVEAAFASGASTSDYLHLDDTARGLLDTATLASGDTWEDISSYVHRIGVKRGATRVESPILRYESGTAAVELDNSDRRFDPTNLSGPYVSAGVTQVTPMRAIRIRATWAGVTYDLFRGFADGWKISYIPPNYSLCALTATDATKVLTNYQRAAVGAVGGGENTGARVTRILNSVSWSASDRIIATGNTTVQATTLDGDAWTELLLTSDTELGEIYVDEAGRVYFRNRQAVMTDLRSTSANAVFGDQPVTGVETTVNLVTNPSAETTLDSWAVGGSLPPTLGRSTTHAEFGSWAVLATWDTGGTGPYVGTTVSGLSVGKTYVASAYVYVPSGSPDVVITISGGPLGTSTSTKDAFVRLSVSDVATATSWSVQIWPVTSPTSGQKVYVDGAQVEEGATPETYCDGTQTSCEWDGAAHASTSRRLPELHYADVEIDYDDSTIANYVKITRVGGAEQTAQDATSEQLYLTQTFERTDLIMEADDAAADYADFILYQAKDPELRISTLTIRPDRAPTELYPQVLGRQFGDRIRIIRRPPGGGTITSEAIIRGIEYGIERDNWTVTWTLQSATKWAYLVLNHTTLGVLDSNALGY